MPHMQLNTIVAGGRAIFEIAYSHPPATDTTEHNPLEQGSAFAHGPPALLGTKGPVVVELLLVEQKLFPGDVAGVSIVDHNRPVLSGDRSCSPFDQRRFAGQEAGAGLRPTVDVDAGIGRVVQD